MRIGLGEVLVRISFGLGGAFSVRLARPNIGALIIRIGLGIGGILYYKYNKEPPKPYSNH